jgi:hypothetical protein
MSRTYTLELDGIPIDMNAKIGKTIKLSFDGTINCIACGQLTKKTRTKRAATIRVAIVTKNWRQRSRAAT